MKTWIVRFVSLYAFNVLVLWVIGLLLPTVSVGWSAFWASIILTAATIWVKPLISKAFSGAIKTSSGQRTAAGEKLVQYGSVLLVELIVWFLVVLLSGVNVRGWFWGYLLPPLILLVAWIIYDRIDDVVHAKTGQLYDRAEAGIRGRGTATAGTSASTATSEVRAELNDGLTPEQRRMLDELGKS